MVIEDKIDTKEGNDQLNSYKSFIEKEYFNQEKFFVYVKIGDEYSYQYILEKGYSVVNRKDLLKEMESYKSNNDILMDYYQYLYLIEEDFNSYQHQDLEKWFYRGWKGFYQQLNQKVLDGEWYYVPN